jgi:hypothetical protein
MAPLLMPLLLLSMDWWEAEAVLTFGCCERLGFEFDFIIVSSLFCT